MIQSLPSVATMHARVPAKTGLQIQLRRVRDELCYIIQLMRDCCNCGLFWRDVTLSSVLFHCQCQSLNCLTEQRVKGPISVLVRSLMNDLARFLVAMATVTTLVSAIPSYICIG